MPGFTAENSVTYGRRYLGREKLIEGSKVIIPAHFTGGLFPCCTYWVVKPGFKGYVTKCPCDLIEDYPPPSFSVRALL
jgi:hypothetical protein